MFKDRMDAADKLATRLASFRQDHPLVLGIARGAVPMAARIAQALDTEWDVLLAKKLAAPGNPEFAVGAIDESGWVYVSPMAGPAGVDDAYLRGEKDRQMALMHARRAQYDEITPRLDPAGRTVIVVDDGLATGATMMAALHGLRQQGVRKSICAVPIGSKQSVASIRAVADETICLQVPEEFYAVSQGYQHFEQVEDTDVLDLLRRKTPRV